MKKSAYNLPYGVQDIAVIDFETFWSQDYTLKKLATTDYINDERFKAHCCSFKMVKNGAVGKTISVPTHKIQAAFDNIDWTRTAMLCHHTQFDGAIAAWHYGVNPALYLCSMTMARPLHGAHGVSLDRLAKLYGMKGKVRGKALQDTKGVRDLSPEQLRNMMAYNIDDTDDTWGIFQQLITLTQQDELFLIDKTIRMYTEPTLLLDTALVEQTRDTAIETRETKVAAAKTDAKALGSAEQFAELLRKAGAEPPIKISPRTDKPTYAFAKNDLAFKALLKHPKKAVRALVEARLGVKSNLLEKRSAAILKRAGIAQPIYLKQYGAHTLRWAGGDGVNWQNLPRGSKLREALMAPPGTNIMVKDQSQIEARLSAWFAGQIDKLKAFAAYDDKTGPDVYKFTAATAVYNKPYEQITEEERFVGKTCLARGSLVLCERGWIPIEQVSISDRVWDGEEWVCHSGVAHNGTRAILNLSGLLLTSDHRVLCGTTWMEAASVLNDSNIHYQALVKGAENLPLQGMLQPSQADSHNSSFGATVAKLNTRWTGIILKTSKVRAALYALKNKLALRVKRIGNMLKSYPTTHIERGYSTALAQPSHAVTQKLVSNIRTTEPVVSRFMSHGEKIERSFLNTSLRLKDGIIRSLRWIVSIPTKVTYRAIYGSLHELLTPVTNDVLVTSKLKYDVYDLLSSGPRNRFTVLTNDGPIIVHNCELGLGYGAGKKKFAYMLRVGQFGPPVDIEDEKAVEIVTAWRAQNNRIVQFWKELERKFKACAMGQKLVEFGPCAYERHKESVFLHLPNGTFMYYHNVQLDEDNGLSYDAGKVRTRLWGGLLVENLIQAMSRVIIAANIIDIYNAVPKIKIASTTHDELIMVHPIVGIDKADKQITKIMRTPPSWAPDLPLNVSGAINARYVKA